MELIKNMSKQVFQDIRREYNYHNIRAINSIVFLTYRCTSQCKTCNIWRRTDSKNKELSWDKWEKILKNMKDYSIKSVEIFGGDALLRKDIIFKMIEFCSQNGIETYFPTNSLLLDKETIKGLIEAGLGTLYFSLDDIGSDNDYIRGIDGAFPRVKKALEYVVELRGVSEKPHIVICTTISKMNYKHFEAIVEFLGNYPVNAIYPRVIGEFTRDNIQSSSICGVMPEPFFVSTDDTSHRLSQDEYNEFKKIMTKLKQRKTAKLPYINFRAFDDTDEDIIISGQGSVDRCLMCSTVAIVDPFGSVSPCLFFDKYTLGNLTANTLQTIWGSDKHKKFIKSQRQKQLLLCRNCISHFYYSSPGKTISYYKKRMYEKICGLK